MTNDNKDIIKQLNELTQSATNSIIQRAFRKNNVNPGGPVSLSDAEKENIKNMVEDLKRQAETFMKKIQK